MKIGITGHQERDGIDWAWVDQALRSQLDSLNEHFIGLSSLAKGSDQLFAKLVLDMGGDLIAVIPRDDYERFFKPPFLQEYRDLLAKAKHVDLHSDDEQESFLRAGLYVADHSDLLIAVWDGNLSQGKGGTADIVQHVINEDKPWIHIDPIKRVVYEHL
jgi:hypothetical protein